jgi:proteasome lid subunit RPN8/RPN11
MQPHNPRLQLPPEIGRELIALALQSPQVEVCGLLGGNRNELRSYYPICNIADDPGRLFVMDPVEQLRAFRQMNQRGEELRAIYHSHPASAALPSGTDLALAKYPQVYYLIASLLSTPPEMRAYYFTGEAFTPVELDDRYRA